MPDAVAEDIRFLDSVRELPAAAARKAQLAVTLGVGAGDVVIELGPGTGEELQRFATAAGPRGLAVGVDISPELVQEARRRAAELVLVVADARQLPFRSEAFSRGYAERVLQHVPEVEDAVAELYRVLVPEGRVLVFEPDQELRALDHPDVETERVLRRRVAPLVANPAIGRQLSRLLTAAGFAVDSIDGTATGRPGSVSFDRVAEAVSDAVRDGDVPVDRAERYLATLETMVAKGPVLSVWVAFEAAATKRS